MGFILARFHDGPLTMTSDGLFSSGELVTEPVADRFFATGLDVIEFQLSAGSRSRTTWILVESGREFIPCSLGFPPAQNWHARVLDDGRSIVRVLGKRYEVTPE
ncbi:MAG: hypothetical protein ABGX04_18035 [Myxococcales bacterium]|nr:hypothetical protein [Myxococcales bacterium]HIK83857.1 hypothetical protein [Myxococcales bacterium]